MIVNLKSLLRFTKTLLEVSHCRIKTLILRDNDYASPHVLFADLGSEDSDNVAYITKKFMNYLISRFKLLDCESKNSIGRHNGWPYTTAVDTPRSASKL